MRRTEEERAIRPGCDECLADVVEVNMRAIVLKVKLVENEGIRTRRTRTKVSAAVLGFVQRVTTLAFARFWGAAKERADRMATRNTRTNMAVVLGRVEQANAAGGMYVTSGIYPFRAISGR